MKYIFFTDLRSSKIAEAQKVVPKGMQSYKTVEATKKDVPKGAQRKFWRSYKKSFLRERSVSFLLKIHSNGNAEPNTAEI